MFKPKEAAKVKGRDPSGGLVLFGMDQLTLALASLPRITRLDQDTFLVANRQLLVMSAACCTRTCGVGCGTTPRARCTTGPPQSRDRTRKSGTLSSRTAASSSRLVAVGPSLLAMPSTGESFAFPNMHIEDRQVWHEPVERITVMDERGVLVVPSYPEARLASWGAILSRSRNGMVESSSDPWAPSRRSADGEKLS